MTTQDADAKLTPSYGVEVSDMPVFRCAVCGQIHTVQLTGGTTRVSGISTCGCSAKTGFTIDREVTLFVTGQSSFGLLSNSVPQEAKEYFSEAEGAFMSALPNSAGTMCRASVEVALTKAGFPAKNLYDQIEDATRAGKLGQEDAMLAHGSRLATREAIHRGNPLTIADLPPMLSATVRILNKLCP